jgi:hypothetical protein
VVGLATINILLYLVRTKHHVLLRNTPVVEAAEERDNGFDELGLDSAFHPLLPQRETGTGVSLLVRDYDDWSHNLVSMANAVGRAVREITGEERLKVPACISTSVVFELVLLVHSHTSLYDSMNALRHLLQESGLQWQPKKRQCRPKVGKALLPKTPPGRLSTMAFPFVLSGG